jgi:hypothetical protein
VTLDRDGSSPPKLADVMHALRQESPSAKRLEAVEQELGPLLDAELPSSTTPGLLSRLWQGKSAAPGLGLAAVVVVALGGAVLWRLSSRQQHRSEHEQTFADRPQRSDIVRTVPNAREVPPRAAADLSPSETPTSSQGTPGRAGEQTSSMRVHADGGDVAASLEREGARRASRVAQKKTFRVRGTERGDVRSTTAREAGPVREAPSVAAFAQGPGTLSDAPSETSEAKPAARGAAPVALDVVALPPAKSEVDLIHDAHAAMRHDPRAALRLLDEHGARFADGLMVPEREVLAIEALRALGAESAAAARLAAFRTRYPDSVHLRRLDAPSR